MDIDDNFIKSFETKPCIKLTKNSRGYSWEIRIMSLDVEELQKINLEMEKRFGKDYASMKK